jgi:hypothetical protein
LTVGGNACPVALAFRADKRELKIMSRIGGRAEAPALATFNVQTYTFLSDNSEDAE